MNRQLGLLLIGAGVLAVVVGALVWSGALSWFGRLPGDVSFSSGRTRVFIPITSAILASVVLTVVVNLLLRWFR